MTTRPEPALDPKSVVVRTESSSYVVSPRAEVATIGRDPQAQVHIDDPRISRMHVRIEFVDGRWRAVDTSMNGMFLGTSRAHSIAITDGGHTVRLGDPVVGPAVRFELTSTTPREPIEEDATRLLGASRPDDLDDSELTRVMDPDDEVTVTLDPGMLRAGAAAAARRRELDISQRSLAGDGIINAGALIAFEKGRSWPRDRTRAKLEEVLQWPPGTIAQIREGRGASPTAPSMPLVVADEAPLVAQAVEAAVNTLSATIDSLPGTDDPNFMPRTLAILADLRQLETVAARATKLGRITPPLLKVLSTVRREIDELTLRAASAPTATLGQRLYAWRRRATLTIGETAQAAGLPEEAVSAAEADRPIPAPVAELIEALLAHLD